MSRITRLARLLVAAPAIAGILSCRDAQPVAPESAHSTPLMAPGGGGGSTTITIVAGPTRTNVTVKKGCLADVCKGLVAANATLGGVAFTVEPIGVCPGL